MELRKCIKSAQTLINKLNKLLKFGGERKAKPPKPNKEDRNRWGFPCAKQR